MARFGMFLLGCTVLGFMLWGLKSAYDQMYGLINSTVNMTATESVIWRAMPLAIPAILFVLLVLFLTGYLEGRGKKEDGG